MSLAIQCDNVKRVLLSDGWHTVYEDSFGLDSYEYLWGDKVMHGGGNSNVCATGFVFQEKNKKKLKNLAGPLTSIFAVEFNYKKLKSNDSPTP